MTDYTDLIDELTWFAEQDKDFISLQDSINTKAAEAIKALVAERDELKAQHARDVHTLECWNKAITDLQAERDAAFAMSKCECESNEACKNLVALHDEVTYLEECVSSHEKDKCSAQESFGKCFTENQKLHKEITTLKSALREAEMRVENLADKLFEVLAQDMSRDKAIATIKEVIK